MVLNICVTFRRRLFQYIATIGACFAILSLGMHFGWASLAIPQLQNGTYDFTITPNEGSWLASLILVGALLGDLVAPFLMKTYGRKNPIFAATIFLLVSWILTATGPSSIYLLTGKFLAGVSDGIFFTILPTFLTEIADPEIRGILGSSFFVTWVLGILLMNIFLYILPMKIANYLAAITAIPLIATFPFLPDTAHAHLLKNKYEAAKESLQKYSGRKDVSEDLTRISNAVVEELKNQGGVMDIFINRTYRKVFAISVSLSVFGQLTGAMAVLMYCETVFEESKSHLDPKLSNLIFFIVFFIFMTVNAFTIDKFGRRSLLIVSTTGSSVCLASYATFLVLKQYRILKIGQLEYVEIIFLFLYIAFYAFGLISIPAIITSEIYPTNMKGIGQSAVNISFNISATVIIQYFTWTSEGVGMYAPFYSFACCSLVALVFVIMLVPETKGRSLEEIQSLLRGRKVSSHPEENIRNSNSL